jgi:hypothetical protein
MEVVRAIPDGLRICHGSHGFGGDCCSPVRAGIDPGDRRLVSCIVPIARRTETIDDRQRNMHSAESVARGGTMPGTLSRARPMTDAARRRQQVKVPHRPAQRPAHV